MRLTHAALGCAMVTGLAVAVGLALPALSQVQRRLDGIPIQAANIDLLANDLIAQGALVPGERILVRAEGGTPNEQFFFHSHLVSGLIRRGLLVTVREAAASKVLVYSWVRDGADSISELKTLDINGRPDPATLIRNRVAFTISDISSGLILKSGMATAESLPFALPEGQGHLADKGNGLKNSSGSLALGSEPKGVFGSVPLSGDRNGVGLSASWLAGSGITYRRWLDNGFGYQVAAIPFFQPNNGEAIGFVNFGVAAMGTLLRAESFRGFWILGYGTYLTRENVFGANGDRTVKALADLGIAPGFGIDYLIGQNLALHAGLAYTVSFKIRPPERVAEAGWGFGPGGQIGTFFYF